MKTVSEVFNSGRYQIDCIIDDISHMLKLIIKRESGIDTLSFFIEDKIINLPSELQENIQKQGIYRMFTIRQNTIIGFR